MLFAVTRPRHSASPNRTCHLTAKRLSGASLAGQAGQGGGRGGGAKHRSALARCRCTAEGGGGAQGWGVPGCACSARRPYPSSIYICRVVGSSRDWGGWGWGWGAEGRDAGVVARLTAPRKQRFPPQVWSEPLPAHPCQLPAMPSPTGRQPLYPSPQAAHAALPPQLQFARSLLPIPGAQPTALCPPVPARHPCHPPAPPTPVPTAG